MATTMVSSTVEVVSIWVVGSRASTNFVVVD